MHVYATVKPICYVQPVLKSLIVLLWSRVVRLVHRTTFSETTKVKAHCTPVSTSISVLVT